MKRLFAACLPAFLLSGCAVVSPYDRTYSVYSHTPAHVPVYDHGYTTYAPLPAPPAVTYVPTYPAPVYVVPAPMYGAPVYVGPPVRFSFGLNFHSGRRHHYGYGFRGHGGFHGRR